MVHLVLGTCLTWYLQRLALAALTLHFCDEVFAIHARKVRAERVSLPRQMFGLMCTALLRGNLKIQSTNVQTVSGRLFGVWIFGVWDFSQIPGGDE